MLVEGMNHVLKEVQGDRLAQLPSYFDRELPLHEDLVAGMMEFINALD